MLAFESATTVLRFLHLVGAVITLAACVHLLLRLRRLRDAGRIRLHALLLMLGYLTTYLLGALVYPTFRVHVRADVLDETHPWVTGLFEIKEHAATIFLIPVVTVFVASRVLDPSTRSDARYLALVRGLAGMVLAVLVYNACVGWYVATLRGL